RHVMPLAAPAALGSASLRRRVHRILSIDRRASWRRWRVAAALAGASVCVLAAGVGGIQAIDAAIADAPLVAMAVHGLGDGERVLHVSETLTMPAIPAHATQARAPRRRPVLSHGPVRTSVPSLPEVTSVNTAEYAQTETTIHASSIAAAVSAGAPRPPTSN